MLNKAQLASLLCMVVIVGGCASLPPPQEGMPTSWAEQGWTNDERHWYHHAHQGTNTFGIPFEWLMALEQPSLQLFGTPSKLMDQAYLARMGFIPSPTTVKTYGSGESYGYAASNIPSQYSGADYNLADLPVGFAVGGEWVNMGTGDKLPLPGTGKNARSVGLTCAACHTGQLEYEGQRILIDGSQAMVSLDMFRETLGLAMAYTTYVPGRFNRFAEAVLKEHNTATNRKRLKQQFNRFVVGGKEKRKLENTIAALSVEEGFTRLDALNRIGNQVFAVQMKLPENFHPTSAPVSFPHIWNTSWFDWVQYNSSIQQPMVRNLGEALGVSAPVNLSHPGPTLFASAVPIDEIHRMEQLLGGEEHPLDAGKFGGLASPQWEKIQPLPPLDKGLVAAGRRLYMGDPAASDEQYRRGLCVRCHLPPLKEKQIFADTYWSSPTEINEKQYPYRYLALRPQPVMKMGTDCATAYDMAYRTVVTPTTIPLKHAGTLINVTSHPPECQPTPVPSPNPNSMNRTNFGVALGDIVESTKAYWYDQEKIPPEERLALDGYRPNGIRATIEYRQTPEGYMPANYPSGSSSAVVEELPAYKPRPLNGVWATAPFLHNGSVPTLYLLLSTQEERNREAQTFYLGSRAFDPTYLGYAFRGSAGPVQPEMQVLGDTQGLFKLDTTIPGNRNTGHLFTDAEVPGRIGPQLSHNERLALLEFIKSL